MAAMEINGGPINVYHISIQRLCRICLSNIDDRSLDLLSPGDYKYSCTELLEYVHGYFGLTINLNDGLSSKMCAACLTKIDTWLADRKMVEKCNIVIEFLTRNPSTPIDMVTSPMETTNILEAVNSIPQKPPVLCPFCNNYEKKNGKIDKKHFCKKHSNAHTCLYPSCHIVFPSKEILIPHYRLHLKLKKTEYLCSKCLGVLDCPRKVSHIKHEHQYTPDLFRCCGLQFPTMIDFVCHEFQDHNALVVMRNTLDPMFKNLPNQKLQRSKTSLKHRQRVQTRKCVARTKSNTIVTPKSSKINKALIGEYICKVCQLGFFSVGEYITHSKVKHNNSYLKKAKEISLCPLCDMNYSITNYVAHISDCTNSMTVGDGSLNQYGCIFCSKIFSGLTQCQFRNHFNFCKTFTRVSDDSKTDKDDKLMKCRNCTFTSTNIENCIKHANTYCVYLKLKMKFAMRDGEKEEVFDKMNEHGNKKKIDSSKIKPKDTTNQEIHENTNCDVSRQKLLGYYSYLCNVCDKKFFTLDVFVKHLTSEGVTCRSVSLIYCDLCLRDFKSNDAFIKHRPFSISEQTLPPPPPPYAIAIKTEQQMDFELNEPANTYDENYIVSMPSDNGIELEDDAKESIKLILDANGSTSYQESSLSLQNIKVDEEEKPYLNLNMVCVATNGECSSHLAN